MVDSGFDRSVSALGTLDVWTLAFLFGFQIYFDFAGYSYIAIGSARLMGIQFPENFNYPYMATSPRDFWRRWHISLSSWNRDYLYLPLAGATVVMTIPRAVWPAPPRPSITSAAISPYLPLGPSWGCGVAGLAIPGVGVVARTIRLSLSNNQALVFQVPGYGSGRRRLDAYVGHRHVGLDSLPPIPWRPPSACGAT